MVAESGRARGARGLASLFGYATLFVVGATRGLSWGVLARRYSRARAAVAGRDLPPCWGVGLSGRSRVS